MRALGPYRIIEEIARGGAGVVYRAHDPALRRDVAIKLLLQGNRRPESIRRLFREARALARLRHPHVVSVLDVGESEGVPYLVMEFVPGETLDQRLERLGPLEPQAAADLTAKLASALSHAHAHGLVHRDLKPANVLLDAQHGEPRLTDFGLAQDRSGAVSQAERLSQEGVFLGTPGYWSPEQAHGELEAIGPAADVWGLGAILFAALTGRPPYAGTTLMTILDALRSPPPAPSALRPEIPAQLDSLCRRCLSLDPDLRPTLAQVAAGLHDAAEPSPPRRRLGATRLLAGAALVLVGAALATLTAPAAPPAARPSPSLASPGEASVELQAAQQRLGTEDFVGALSASERALRLDPGLVPAHLAQARALVGLGRTAEGDAALARVTALAPDDLDVGLFRSQRLYAQGSAGLAQRELRRLVQLHPESSLARLHLGDMLLRAGYAREALTEFDHAVALAPNSTLALLRRARSLLLEHPDRAERDARAALALEPDSAPAHFTLGLSFQNQDRIDEALRAYQHALRLDPDHAAALAYIASIRLSQRNLDEAQRLAERAYALHPGLPIAAGVLGDVHLQRGDLQRARELLDEALAERETFVGACQARARLHLTTGSPEAALRDARAALRAGAQSADTYAILGSALKQLDRNTEARAAYEQALDLDPQHMAAAFGMATTYRQGGSPQDLLTWSQRALALDPAFRPAQLLAAMAKTQLGRHEEALADTTSILEVAPDHVAAAFVQATVLLRLRRLPECAALLERFLALPGDLEGNRVDFERLLDAAQAGDD